MCNSVIWKLINEVLFCQYSYTATRHFSCCYAGSNRLLEVDKATVAIAKEMLRKHKEFSILTAVRQKPESAGSIISFTVNGKRYLPFTTKETSSKSV